MKSIFYLPVALLITNFFTGTPALKSQETSDVFKVVLDAGHGGHDPGNLGNGYMEKNIALGIVLQIGEHLKQYPDIEVIYTRDDDSFVDLYVRGEIANKKNADLFVSVHCDSHSSDAHGAHTFVLGLHANDQNFEIAKKENSVIYLEDNYESRYAEYNINSPESVIGLTIMQEEFLDQSIQLAKMVQENFSKKLNRRDRKVKQAGFIVLHQTFMPSILIETGFLTNKDEGRYLNSKKGQKEMGKAISEAIVSYKKNVRSDASVSFLPGEDQVPDTPVRDMAQKDNLPEAKKDVPPVVENTRVVPVKTPQQEVKQMTEKTSAELKTPQKIDPPAETASNKEEVFKSDQVIKSDNPANAVLEKVEQEDKGMDKKSSQIPAVKKPEIIFKVQIMASAKDLSLDPKNFNGLNNISKEPYKNLYRYTYGNTDSYQQAKIFKAGADASGYTTSYIVAYENGVRIPVKEALTKL